MNDNSEGKIIDLGSDDYEIIDDEPMNMGQFYKREAKESFRNGFLYLNQYVKYSVSSKKNKIGRIKTEVLNKAMEKANNFDLKIQDKFEEAQIAGMSLVSKGIKLVSDAKNSVVSYTSEQIDKYRQFKYDLQQRINDEIAERESKKNREDSEKIYEAEVAARTADHKAAMTELLNERDKEQNKEKILNFKNEVANKINSKKGKISQMKTSLLNKVMFYAHNFDLKIQEKFEEAQIAGMSLVSKGIKSVSDAKNSVISYTSEQIDKYRQFRYDLQQRINDEIAERESKKNREDSEKIYEAEVAARTADHKSAMTELLNERDKEQNKENILNFKNEVANKINSKKGKIGQMKTSLLNKVMFHTHNFDLKIQEKFEEAQIAGMSLVSKGIKSVSDAKNSVISYTSEQIDKYRQFKYDLQQHINDKIAERKSEKNRRESEKIYEAEVASRTADHKAAMTELLKSEKIKENEKERQKRKTEIETLKAQKKYLKEILMQQTADLISSNPKSR